MVRKEMPNKVQACKVTLMKVPHFGKYKDVEISNLILFSLMRAGNLFYQSDTFKDRLFPLDRVKCTETFSPVLRDTENGVHYNRN